MAKEVTFKSHVEVITRATKSHVAFIPVEVSDQMGLKANTRLILNIKGKTFERAALSDGNGRFYLSMGGNVRRDAKLRKGDEVAITIQRDPDPDKVDVPEELEAALDNDPEALKVFNELTPGKQRGVIHYITQPKTEASRIKRALQMSEKLRTRTLHGMKKEK